MQTNNNQQKNTPHRGNILVVDDNPANLRLLCSILSKHGYKARPAASGKLAIQSAQHKLPDIVLLDIRMLEMNGYEVCRTLKADPNTAEVPVIFISALEEEEDKVKAFQAGGVDYLTKPFHETEVLARIATHLNLYKMQQNREELVALRTEELQKSHALYRESQEIAKLGHWELDLITNHLSWSDEIFRIFEIDKEKFPASYETFLGLVHPDDRELVNTAYTSSLKNRTQYDIVHRLLFSDGKVKYVQEKCRTNYDEKGDPVYSLGTVQDITERKQAEDQIKKAKDEWERTFQAIGDIATIQDLNHRITRVNKKACDIFSAQPDELEGKLCYEVFRGVNAPCQGCPAVDSLKNFEVHTAEVEHEQLEKTFIVSASPFFDMEGNISGIIHFAKDITDQKKLEGQLRQAQKMEAIGTLAGGIAHDFNNILTPIFGYAEMALETIPADSPTASEIHGLLKAAKRAKELVKQILTFSRQAEKELQPLEIQFVIKEALKLARASIPTTIEIRQNIDPACSAVLADPTQIHQVIMNLCTNAYHAMRETGGVLGVALSQVELGPGDLQNKLDLKPGTYVMLEVNDTGHGMNRDVMEKIFDPYFTTKVKGEGTGLGLSVVHGIVQNLCGNITVYSELEQGTSFHVYLPIIKTEPQKITEEIIPIVLPSGHERIFVLDDEEEITELERRILESLGYQVTNFTNCEEALKAFRTKPDSFDLIITDMTMPKITGFELAREVLSIRPEMPIIICSGFSEFISEETAKAAGIREFIMKPILKRDLAQIVRKVLDGEQPMSLT